MLADYHMHNPLSILSPTAQIPFTFHSIAQIVGFIVVLADQRSAVGGGGDMGHHMIQSGVEPIVVRCTSEGMMAIFVPSTKPLQARLAASSCGTTLTLLNQSPEPLSHF